MYELIRSKLKEGTPIRSYEVELEDLEYKCCGFYLAALKRYGRWTKELYEAEEAIEQMYKKELAKLKEKHADELRLKNSEDELQALTTKRRNFYLAIAQKYGRGTKEFYDAEDKFEKRYQKELAKLQKKLGR